jgi:hypothetical protein
MAALTLKPGYSLKGLSPLLLVKVVRGHDGPLPIPLAWLRADFVLQDYGLEELKREALSLAGVPHEEVFDLLPQPSPYTEKEQLLLVMHYGILLANDKGKPSGQPLAKSVSVYVSVCAWNVSCLSGV